MGVPRSCEQFLVAYKQFEYLWIFVIFQYDFKTIEKMLLCTKYYSNYQLICVIQTVKVDRCLRQIYKHMCADCCTNNLVFLFGQQFTNVCVIININKTEKKKISDVICF